MSTPTLPPAGTVLGVWAHPDDEAYLSAGLMAATTRAGRRVAVVTATFGERGTSDPDRWPPARLAALRRREMAASLAAVGVHDHRWLDHADGACADVDPERAAATIGRILERVRPDTIVTFGPDGMTGHPDHVAVSGWVSRAWRRHRPQAALWHATLLPSFHEQWGELNGRIGIFGDAEPPCTPDADTTGIVRCDGPVLDAKVAALTAHRSQTAPLIAEVGAATFRRWWSVEAFADGRDVAVEVAA